MLSPHLDDAVIDCWSVITRPGGALGRAGRTPTNPGFLGFSYRDARAEPSFGHLDRALVSRLRAVSALYAPAALGSVHSIMTSSEPMPSPWQRRASRSPCTPIFPTASVHGWPSWVTGTPPDPYLDVEVSWSSSLGVFRHLCTGRGAVVVRLSDDDATEKLAAMRAYRT